MRLRVRARQRTRLVRRVRERAPTPAAARDLASRAGIAPADQDRVARHRELDLPVARLARCVVRLDGVPAATPLTCEDYLTLIDATGRVVRSGKRGAIDPRLAPILARLDLRVEDWVRAMSGWRQMRGTAIGASASRADEAARRGLRWIKNSCALFAGRAA